MSPWSASERARATVLWRSHLALLAVRRAGRAGGDATRGLSILGAALRQLPLAGMDAFEDVLRDGAFAEAMPRAVPDRGPPPSAAEVEAFADALASACELCVLLNVSRERATTFADALEWVPAAMLDGNVDAPLLTDPGEPEEIRAFTSRYRQNLSSWKGP